MVKPVPSLGTPIAATNPVTQTWYEFFQSILTDLKFAYDFAKGYVPPGHDDTKSDVTRSINSQTGTSYTFALSDSGKICEFSSASAVTVTIPPHSSVAFDTGAQIDVVQGGAGKVTFSPGSGVTLKSIGSNKSLFAQEAGGTLVQMSQDVWRLIGNLSP